MVDGALYTDVNAQLPALYLLIAISLSAVVLLVFNLRQRGWTLPIIAVGLWAFVAIVMGGIYPAFVQRFQVEPNETSREVEFTQRNIDATREAFGSSPTPMSPRRRSPTRPMSRPTNFARTPRPFATPECSTRS